MKLILIGIQGSGKSTQGNLLVKKLKIPYLSSGHIFRQMSKEKSALGRYIKETMNAGYLIPDDKTVDIIEEYLAKPTYQDGYILDGFPRTVEQAKVFKNGVEHVVFLNVSDKEALWRLSGREEEGVREDNTLKALRKRIELFHEKTKPVLSYYKRRGVLREVNGEESITKVHRAIMKLIR